MKFLIDEMYGARVSELLRERGHDAIDVREIGLLGAPDADVLARAVDEQRTLVSENAADFVPLLNQRQSTGLATTPVLVALTAGRGGGGALHATLAEAVHAWAASKPDPYAHVDWLP